MQPCVLVTQTARLVLLCQCTTWLKGLRKRLAFYHSVHG